MADESLSDVATCMKSCLNLNVDDDDAAKSRSLNTRPMYMKPGSYG